MIWFFNYWNPNCGFQKRLTSSFSISFFVCLFWCSFSQCLFDVPFLNVCLKTHFHYSYINDLHCFYSILHSEHQALNCTSPKVPLAFSCKSYQYRVGKVNLSYLTGKNCSFSTFWNNPHFFHVSPFKDILSSYPLGYHILSYIVSMMLFLSFLLLEIIC